MEKTLPDAGSDAIGVYSWAVRRELTAMEKALKVDFKRIFNEELGIFFVQRVSEKNAGNHQE